jgi:hypothetical protein
LLWPELFARYSSLFCDYHTIGRLTTQFLGLNMDTTSDNCIIETEEALVMFRASFGFDLNVTWDGSKEINPAGF